MRSVIDLVLFCVFWIILQLIIYTVIHSYTIKHKDFFSCLICNHLKAISYGLAAVLSTGICLLGNHAFFSGLENVRLYSGWRNTAIIALKGIFALTVVYFFNTALSILYLYIKRQIVRFDTIRFSLMKGNINLSDLIMSVLFAPVIEEIIFRGLMYEKMILITQKNWAFILVAIGFALVHINPKKMIYAFIISMILSACYIKTGILTAIICHAYYNFLSNIYIAVVEKERQNETK